MTIRTALLSVSDKTGLVPFAQFLSGRGVTLLSTGGTAKALREAGLAVTDVSGYTGFPEIMDGRVKTLHPKIHGGLLGMRGNAEHRAAMEAHGISAIDLVVITLYPFEATVAKGSGFEECIEHIDIGGPSMIRSAAKNHGDVTVVTDPADYASVQEAMEKNNDATTEIMRRELAAKAFALTARYDTAIGEWFAKQLGEREAAGRHAPDVEAKQNPFPEKLTVTALHKQSLRYGENPHQAAAFYTLGSAVPGVATARQLQGKELSYNNINDTDAAFELVRDIAAPAVAIIKHANPCGVATGKTMVEAYRKALACDPTSAFGGIVALNRALDAEAAQEIAKLFVEVIIAPEAEPEAVEIIAAKKNLRLLVTGPLSAAGKDDPMALTLKSVAGGLLVQRKDAETHDEAQLKTVTRAQVSSAQMTDLKLAFAISKHVKSNSIVLVKNGATIGIGAGQMSRIDATRIACWKAEAAGLLTQGAVLASDAFFPFPDNVERAAEAGIAAIIQPGGSVRDAEVIAAGDAAGIAMVFTGIRHFRH